jgi:hypothetical protein
MSAGHSTGDSEEQQDSQNGGLHDNYSVERIRDGIIGKYLRRKLYREPLGGSRK